MLDRKNTAQTEFIEILEQVQKFQAEMERLESSPTPERQPAIDPDIQQAIDELMSSPAYVPVGRLAQMYDEDRPATNLVEQETREIDQYIAEELQLSPDLTIEDLKRLRREFAAENHPDRVDAAEKRSATRRMTLVNVLIDKALKEKQTRDGRR